MTIELPDPGSKLGQALQQALLPGETIVQAVLNGTTRHTNVSAVLVATNLRAIIIKGRGGTHALGTYLANALGTYLATGYHYRQMTGITMKTRPLAAGTVEIFAAGLPPEYMAKAGEAPNTFNFIAIPARQEPVKEVVDFINKQVASASMPPSQPPADIPEQIRQLAALRDAGVLSNEEFEAKKAELLSRM